MSKNYPINTLCELTLEGGSALHLLGSDLVLMDLIVGLSNYHLCIGMIHIFKKLFVVIEFTAYNVVCAPLKFSRQEIGWRDWRI